MRMTLHWEGCGGLAHSLLSCAHRLTLLLYSFLRSSVEKQSSAASIFTCVIGSGSGSFVSSPRTSSRRVLTIRWRAEQPCHRSSVLR